VTFGRAVFSFIMTFVISDWIARDGILSVFFVVGALHGFACIFGLILYVYGKRVSEVLPQNWKRTRIVLTVYVKVRLAVHKRSFIQRAIGTVKTK
jgi:hypothetical protein